MLSTTYTPFIKFTAILLVEPMILFPPHILAESGKLAAASRKRRDIWPSRAAALEMLHTRQAFQIWDPRVLEKFVVRSDIYLQCSSCTDFESRICRSMDYVTCQLRHTQTRKRVLR